MIDIIKISFGAQLILIYWYTEINNYVFDAIV